MITYDNDLTPMDYIKLREAVGWNALTENQAARGIEHTTFLVSAKSDGETVAMARVLFDYGYTVFISDVIVSPGFQGLGIGKHMLDELLKFIEDNSMPGEFLNISLQAASGKEEFYKKFGFLARPCDGMGAGMTLKVNG